jgi:hypothetical protein
MSQINVDVIESESVGPVTINDDLIVTGSNNIRPYKVYTALLTQIGTNAPVATVLENTIGPIIWTYDGIGTYLATSVGNFTVNKTAIFMNGNSSITQGIYPSINTPGDDITVETAIISPLTYSDDILVSTSIEIRVYP